LLAEEIAAAGQATGLMQAPSDTPDLLTTAVH